MPTELYGKYWYNYCKNIWRILCKKNHFEIIVWYTAKYWWDIRESGDFSDGWWLQITKDTYRPTKKNTHTLSANFQDLIWHLLFTIGIIVANFSISFDLNVCRIDAIFWSSFYNVFSNDNWIIFNSGKVCLQLAVLCAVCGVQSSIAKWLPKPNGDFLICACGCSILYFWFCTVIGHNCAFSFV